MAVVFDAQSSADTTGAAATSFSDSTNMTVGTGSNRAIIVVIQWSSTVPTAISISWNSVALSLVSGTNHGNGTAGNTAIYALANPASGTQTLAGSWTGARDFYVAAVSFSGVDQTTPAINGNFATGSTTPIDISVNNTAGNYLACIFGAAQTITGVTAGTQVFLDNTQTAKSVAMTSVASGSNQHFTATVAATSVFVAANAEIKAAAAVAVVNPLPFWPDSTPQVRSVVNFTPWVFLGRVVPPAPGPAASGGTFTDAGTTFRRVIQYQGISQPINFSVPVIPTNAAASDQSSPGPMFSRRIIYRVKTEPVFVPPTVVFSFSSYVNWPDFASKAKRAADFIPWTFLEPAPQVWFPPNVSPDIVPIRARPTVDFIPWSFVAPTQTTPWAIWTPWPDIAPRRPVPAADFKPWSFIPPPAQVWYPPEKWPDSAPAARRVAHQPDWSYGTFVTPSFIPTWTQWTQWPDFALRAKPVVDFTPWTFLEPPPQVWYPPAVWPDSAPRAKRVVEFPPWVFIEPAPQVWSPVDRWPDLAPAARRVAHQPDWSYGTFITPSFIPTWTQWTQWPDFALRKKPVVDFVPWTFLAPAPQVWYPPNVFPDIVPIRAKPVADFKPWSFVAPTLITPWTQWSPWPDVVPYRAKPAADFIPWSFIPPPAQVWFPPPQWADFARRKLQPLDTQPLIWGYFTSAPGVTGIVASDQSSPGPMFARRIIYRIKTEPVFVPPPPTPWNIMTMWPDFAPIRGKAGLGPAYQQFSARFPGTSLATTVTVTMSAFEINADGFTGAILVIQSQPAVKAAVSIKEIGILGGSVTP